MAPRTRNSSIVAASVSEPSPPLTIISSQDISSIDATPSDVVAPPCSPPTIPSLSKMIRAHLFMFNPPTSADFPSLQNSSFLGGNFPYIGHQGQVPFSDNSLFTANHGLPRAILDRPSHDEQNFQSWKCAASINIVAKNKSFFIEGTIPRPPPNDPSRSTWDICNNMVMSWILQFVSREIAASIMFKTTACEMWTNLKDCFNQSNGPHILQLKTSIGNVKQGDNSVTTYFTQLQALWHELNEYEPNIPCTYGCTCGQSHTPSEDISPVPKPDDTSSSNSLPVTNTTPDEVPSTPRNISTTSPKRLSDYICNTTTASSTAHPNNKYVSYNRLTQHFRAAALAAHTFVEPTTYKMATKNPMLKKAMDTETDALEPNDTWIVLTLPDGHHAIDCKSVYKIKYDVDGFVDRCKARFVVKVFNQKQGIDYFHTFAPVAKFNTMKLMLAVAAINN
uniref:Reverse transcriptase Ty1/copia-type domain-containing protein n=1 Tax=Cannabis sativa TaxID=3483 RepID=A0A803QBP5_CANSA